VRIKTIAITGGTGFVGSSLVRAHLAMGDSVRILTRKESNIFSESDNLHFFYGDLLDANLLLDDFLSGVDVLYHCAAELSDYSVMRQLHVGSTYRLARAASKYALRWVQLSSVGAYSNSCLEVDERCDETPRGEYEVTKQESDDIVRDHIADFVILRPSIIYGESMKNRSLSQMIMMIKKGLFFFIGSGARMNYVHVDDVVAALMLCGRHPSASGRTYILSQSAALEDIVATISEALSIKRPSIRLPKYLVFFATMIFTAFPRWPLTLPRFRALTEQRIFLSNRIINELGFTYSIELLDGMNAYAKKLSTGSVH